jgi:hypothetical protein
MQVTLLDNSLIRRFGSRVLEVDSSVGIALINKRLAIENLNKQVKTPSMDKMIKGPIIDKIESREIFPDLIAAE